jgi:hypothetical protein
MMDLSGIKPCKKGGFKQDEHCGAVVLFYWPLAEHYQVAPVAV